MCTIYIQRHRIHAHTHVLYKAYCSHTYEHSHFNCVHDSHSFCVWNIFPFEVSSTQTHTLAIVCVWFHIHRIHRVIYPSRNHPKCANVHKRSHSLVMRVYNWKIKISSTNERNPARRFRVVHITSCKHSESRDATKYFMWHDAGGGREGTSEQMFQRGCCRRIYHIYQSDILCGIMFASSYIYWESSRFCVQLSTYAHWRPVA